MQLLIMAACRLMRELRHNLCEIKEGDIKGNSTGNALDTDIEVLRATSGLVNS